MFSSRNLEKEKENENNFLIFRYFAKDMLLLATCRAFLPPFRILPPSRSYELLFNEACISAPRIASSTWCAFIVAVVSGREKEYERVVRLSE